MTAFIIRLFLLALLASVSCSGQKSIDSEQEERIPRYITFYWENNKENEFHALSFDSAGCNLFSFGPGQPNARQKLTLNYQDNLFYLQDAERKSDKGQMIIFGDSVVSLVLTEHPYVKYRFIRNSKFEKLFNLLKSKYSFECIQSNEISFNGITSDLTRVEPYLKDSSYSQRSETFEDEIYGNETHYYLDYHGNRFYYYPTGRILFARMEIVSNDVNPSFLDIRIGDTKQQVEMKLSNRIKAYRVSKTKIIVRVCNSRFEGKFGTIIYEFGGSERNAQMLERISYEPLNESE